MSFDDPEENQDEIAAQSRQQEFPASPWRNNPQKPDEQNSGANDEMVKSLAEMMRQHRTPPGPNGEYYKRVYPPMPQPEPEPSIVQKDVVIEVSRRPNIIPRN